MALFPFEETENKTQFKPLTKIWMYSSHFGSDQNHCIMTWHCGHKHFKIKKLGIYHYLCTYPRMDGLGYNLLLH
jgi:hypothetical protein